MSLKHYVVTLKRDTVYPAWVVSQSWPHGVCEGRYFYDNRKQDQNYHTYFEACCRSAPKEYVLDDIQLTTEKGMIAIYRPMIGAEQ